MYEALTLQIYVNGQWHDAFELSIADTQAVADSRITTSYNTAYLHDFYAEIESTFEQAVSVNLPVNWSPVDTKGFPAFILDIIPAGHARKSLLKRFHDEKPPEVDLDLFLLGRCTPSPIGNLRVKESVEALEESGAEAFPRQAVVARSNDFLEYAYEAGAAMSGATGAQGEAPKLLLVEGRDGLLYADAMLDDSLAQSHWLVKFARNSVTENDKNILRAEYEYYKAVASLGLNTVSTKGLSLEEADKPSLWMPRFDRIVDGEYVERIPVESVYSLLGNTEPGSRLKHEAVLAKLIELWCLSGQTAEIPELIFEYIRRDLLNRILGNSDNHGRNTSILRYRERFDLAPIYDLAPMVLDAEGVTRATKWEAEKKGSPKWREICACFPEWYAPDDLYDRIRNVAEGLKALPDLLVNMPLDIRQSKAIPVNDLEKHLKLWELL
ncbi:type II toxin-antitoxin system HipA family toxin [Halopseudomonas salegens]|uniref:Serine/threonine-protein kinase HipA n=1 Tax=Halopseudomonas salegens TaxID=1434072 RepID=A0A1H2E1U8_9GAMM|nr:HipA domain-containing protein [Halopseudomonas salegens]SDT89152.1 serine/threonine-protein kinase HipA [Halopseudomonas salegens]